MTGKNLDRAIKQYEEVMVALKREQKKLANAGDRQAIARNRYDREAVEQQLGVYRNAKTAASNAPRSERDAEEQLYRRSREAAEHNSPLDPIADRYGRPFADQFELPKLANQLGSTSNFGNNEFRRQYHAIVDQYTQLNGQPGSANAARFLKRVEGKLEHAEIHNTTTPKGLAAKHYVGQDVITSLQEMQSNARGYEKKAGALGAIRSYERSLSGATEDTYLIEAGADQKDFSGLGMARKSRGRVGARRDSALSSLSGIIDPDLLRSFADSTEGEVRDVSNRVDAITDEKGGLTSGSTQARREQNQQYRQKLLDDSNGVEGFRGAKRRKKIEQDQQMAQRVLDDKSGVEAYKAGERRKKVEQVQQVAQRKIDDKASEEAFKMANAQKKREEDQQMAQKLLDDKSGGEAYKEGEKQKRIEERRQYGEKVDSDKEGQRHAKISQRRDIDAKNDADKAGMGAFRNMQRRDVEENRVDGRNYIASGRAQKKVDDIQGLRELQQDRSLPMSVRRDAYTEASRKSEGLLQELVNLTKEQKRLGGVASSARASGDDQAALRADAAAKQAGDVASSVRGLITKVGGGTLGGIGGMLSGLGRGIQRNPGTGVLGSIVGGVIGGGGDILSGVVGAGAGAVGAVAAGAGLLATAGILAFNSSGKARGEEQQYLRLGKQLGSRSRLLGGDNGILDQSGGLTGKLKAEGYQTSEIADFLGNAGANKVKDQTSLAIRGTRMANQFGIDLSAVGGLAGAANVAGGRLQDPQMDRVFKLFTASLQEGIARGVSGSELTEATKGLLEFSAKQAGGSLLPSAMMGVLGRFQQFGRTDPAFAGAAGAETFAKIEAAKANAGLGIRGSIIQMAKAEAAASGRSVGEVYADTSFGALQKRMGRKDKDGKETADSAEAGKLFRTIQNLNKIESTNQYLANDTASSERLPGYSKLFADTFQRQTQNNPTRQKAFFADLGLENGESNKLILNNINPFAIDGSKARSMEPGGERSSTQYDNNKRGITSRENDLLGQEIGMRVSRLLNDNLAVPLGAAAKGIDVFVGAIQGAGGAISKAFGGIPGGGAPAINELWDRATGGNRGAYSGGKAGAHFGSSIVSNAALGDSQFLSSVQATAKRLGINPADLMDVMRAESKLDPRAVNGAQKNTSNATGLIQFLPKTAASLGTSQQALLAMSPSEQMAYVEKFLKGTAKRGGNFGDLYAAVHLPALVGKSDDTMAYSANGYGVYNSRAKNAFAYRQNANIDKLFGNNDGAVTKGEMTAFARAKADEMKKSSPNGSPFVNSSYSGGLGMRLADTAINAAQGGSEAGKFLAVSTTQMCSAFIRRVWEEATGQLPGAMAGGDTFGKSATQTFLNFQKKGMTGRLTSEAQLTKGALLFAPNAGKDGIFGTKDDGNGHLEMYAGNGMSVGNDGRPGQKGNTLKYHKLNIKRFSAYANIDPATTQASEYTLASNNAGNVSRTEVHHSYDFKFSSDGALTADQIQQVIRVLKPAAAPKVEPRRQAGINRGKA